MPIFASELPSSIACVACIAMQGDPNSRFDDTELAHNVSSLLMGMIDTTNAAVNFAVDVLLDEPAHLASAAAAAGDEALLPPAHT